MAKSNLPVWCLGASAGGLEAFREVLTNLPPCGAAIVVINHRTGRNSVLPDILSRFTRMRVIEVTEGLQIEKDRVYVIPVNRDMTISGDLFHLAPRSKTHGFPTVISVFLESLARERKDLAVAVILSGVDGDGASALRTVKQFGGTTFAQKFSTAAFPEMPHNAVATGCIDWVLSPREIAEELVRMSEAKRNSDI